MWLLSVVKFIRVVHARIAVIGRVRRAIWIELMWITRICRRRWGILVLWLVCLLLMWRWRWDWVCRRRRSITTSARSVFHRRSITRRILHCNLIPGLMNLSHCNPPLLLKVFNLLGYGNVSQRRVLPEANRLFERFFIIWPCRRLTPLRLILHLFHLSMFELLFGTDSGVFQ